MAARRARDRRGDAHGAEARGALTSPLSRASLCLPHLLSHPLAPLACPSQPLVSEWIDLVRENKREKEADQIANVLRDLGPMPDPDDADDLALWTAALVNPLPALGVAVEIRPLVRYPPPHLQSSTAPSPRSTPLRLLTRPARARTQVLEATTPIDRVEACLAAFNDSISKLKGAPLV